MARGESKDLLTRMADAGEDALHRLAEAPGADRFFGAVSSMRDRVDELQKRVRGLEGIERRVAELEKRLEKVEGGAGSTPAKRTSARTRKTTSTSASSATRASSARRSSGSGSTRKKSS